MGQLFNRNVLLGISGGIAAYKSAQLVRDLQELGATVRVIMTAGATEFITPLTLQALSGNPVHQHLLDAEAEAGMGHIELARWADVILIAPATANCMARLASGAADDLLTTVCLANTGPKLLAPAMNQAMWRDPATTANLNLLQERGFQLVGPAEGTQACGDVGPGRMEEPAAIAQRTSALFDSDVLDGISIVITAGPTREAIDPVRYISNHSSGKMGFALARAAADAGARTTLISGPVNLDTPDHVQRTDVVTAQQMHDASLAAVADCDIFIACAAVADYRPAEALGQKLKKSADTLQLEMVRNPDIVSAVANHPERPFTVGFAAETQDVAAYAQGKLEAKKLDLIIANDVSDTAAGFNSENNAVVVIGTDYYQELGLASKQQLGRQLVALIAEQYLATVV
ncbi:bifunctional phosphopantothenoylcysteine decarboxylase/phosphopantothenate--cysteine ligase CoaBC [Halieaceae bacterium IMCC14734]|uniref:Coenzyme A biosynthesis bifunctional protein CoaBC n=1 Tax=Candidatus Litorirhabdus singularis TaxID=2518993 RepID=A0ABT3TCJ5_9GAMM|nr:bifunctional phosphopantothenoylcysteine decarboxylase/phosphopantothenate--cysteine ligase CoaBC [Candidatus Litorirhabdus singularis]MCX2980023.1 bifunctional phosphopantothenoylcysteine decarboxylase/phosphopantothenate--cysteine ligase CoaBC [Candidatus Litorirhabdus singularis]